MPDCLHAGADALRRNPLKFNPAAPAIKQGYHMPADYCYQKDWDTLMDSYRKCLGHCKAVRAAQVRGGASPIP